MLNGTVLLTGENSIDWVYYRNEPHTPGPEGCGSLMRLFPCRLGELMHFPSAPHDNNNVEEQGGGGLTVIMDVEG